MQIKLEDQYCEACQDGRTKLRPVIVKKNVCNGTRLENVCRREREISWIKNCSLPENISEEEIERIVLQIDSPLQSRNEISHSKVIQMKLPAFGVSQDEEDSRVRFQFDTRRETTSQKPEDSTLTKPQQQPRSFPLTTSSSPASEEKKPSNYIERRKLLFDETATVATGRDLINSRFFSRPTPASLTTPVTTAEPSKEILLYHSRSKHLHLNKIWKL